MASSDSDDFESADEDVKTVVKQVSKIENIAVIKKVSDSEKKTGEKPINIDADKLNKDVVTQSPSAWDEVNVWADDSDINHCTILTSQKAIKQIYKKLQEPVTDQSYISENIPVREVIKEPVTVQSDTTCKDNPVKNEKQSDKSKDNPVKSEKKESTTDHSTTSEDIPEKSVIETSQDTGWDDFNDDWGVDDKASETVSSGSGLGGWGRAVDTDELKTKSKSNIKETENTQKEDKFSDWDDWGDAKESSSHSDSANKTTTATTDTQTAWGWGWGMDSLVKSATTGLSNLTNQVSQHITTVLETGIGAPDPEELARRNIKEANPALVIKEEEDQAKPAETSEVPKASESSFAFGGLLSNVTKMVEATGSRVISGGLNTLETIGKTTMEALQDGDPRLEKKMAMLGLDSNEKPVLSQVLREAKAKAEEEDKIREQKREAKEVHYENLFDDYGGLVHLEALEMLSKQINMRIEEQLRAMDAQKKKEAKETLQQVSELCELPEDEEVDDPIPPGKSKVLALQEKLEDATRDLGIKLQFQPLIRQYTDITTWLDSKDPSMTQKSIYKLSVSGLAQATALCVELYHKAAEMVLVKNRRSTADEADGMTQLTVVLTKHTGQLAVLFAEKLNSIPDEDRAKNTEYITNIFLESGNSSTYIQTAFQLTLPILQIGAI